MFVISVVGGGGVGCDFLPLAVACTPTVPHCANLEFLSDENIRFVFLRKFVWFFAAIIYEYVRKSCTVHINTRFSGNFLGPSFMLILCFVLGWSDLHFLRFSKIETLLTIRYNLRITIFKKSANLAAGQKFQFQKMKGTLA